VAALAGIDLPLMPVEHHYMVTETIPEIAAFDGEIPNISEPSGGYYCRQEGKGLLLGAYESTCVHWSEDGTPKDFGHELLPNDLSRMEENLGRAVQSMPCLENAGIKRIINGPMIFSPDLGPLLGPYPGLKNYFCAAGVMSGFNQGGGIGRTIAEWIIEGEPSLDVFFWDVARFGDWAGKRYTKARTKYFYEHRTDIIYPFQEFAAGRPIRTYPIHDRLAGAGAVFGSITASNIPSGSPASRTSRRTTTASTGAIGSRRWARNAGRCATRSGCWRSRPSPNTRSRAGAAAWLDRLLANRLPRPGKTLLSPC
jgi:Glycine/D-amino acid oxidases (deaminating)